MDSAAPKRAARHAKRHRLLRWSARAGYAASGIVHAIIGVIALILAVGGEGEADQAGALMAIAAAPMGFVALWLIAGTLGALGVWQVLEGTLERADSDGKAGQAAKWGRRLGDWGQAAVYVAIGLIAAAVALGARINAERAAEEASRGMLRLPGGPIVLAMVGLGVAITGIAFVAMGALRSFRGKIDIPRHGIGRSIAGIGVVGFVAKGIALVILGILLIAAAVTSDADTAGGLDGALQALLALAYGPLLVATIGLGLIAYGVFCFFRARFARL